MEPRNTVWSEKRAFYSVKRGGPTLRYMILISIATRRFIWISDAFPGGTSEIRIVQEFAAPLLEPGERILGDQLFNKPALQSIFICPQKNELLEYERLSSIRARVEHSFEMLKNFAIASNTFRSFDYALHEMSMNVLCRIINEARFSR